MKELRGEGASQPGLAIVTSCVALSVARGNGCALASAIRSEGRTRRGYYRARPTVQRDKLARQSGLLTEKNARLVELERANRHMQFMVHDFKRHLSTIGGFVEHLLEKNESTWAPCDIDALTGVRR